MSDTIKVSARAVEPEYVHFTWMEGGAAKLRLDLADAVIDGESKVVSLEVILLPADVDTIGRNFVAMAQ